MPVHQPLNGGCGRPGHSAHNISVRLAMGFGQDVAGKLFRRVFDALRFLQSATGRWNQTCGQPRAAGGPGVTLQNQHLGPSLLGRECGSKAAGTGADHQHIHAVFESRVVTWENSHYLILIGCPTAHAAHTGAPTGGLQREGTSIRTS